MPLKTSLKARYTLMVNRRHGKAKEKRSKESFKEKGNIKGKVKVDNVVKILQKIRKTVREVMVVTGRADVVVVLQGTIDEINNMVIDFKKIKEIVSTETLIEVEVDLGWSKP